MKRTRWAAALLAAGMGLCALSPVSALAVERYLVMKQGDRDEYVLALQQELKELGKPFVVVLNSAQPASDRAQAIRADIAQRYDVTCIAVNCLELGGEDSVGLGSDFDGTDMPPDLSGAEALPNLWRALERRGCGRGLLEKLFYRNLHQFIWQERDGEG